MWPENREMVCPIHETPFKSTENECPQKSPLKRKKETDIRGGTRKKRLFSVVSHVSPKKVGDSCMRRFPDSTKIPSS